jgi:hypothetical protein
MKVSWKGVTAVYFTPTTFAPTGPYGWFNASLVQQAIHGSTDKTGYVFSVKPPYNFSSTGDFLSSYGWLISNAPTIDIEYTGTNWKSVQESWQTKVSVGFTLFGIFSFSSDVTNSGYSNSFESTTGGFSVHFSPPDPAAVPPMDRTATLLGLQTESMESQTFDLISDSGNGLLKNVGFANATHAVLVEHKSFLVNAQTRRASPIDKAIVLEVLKGYFPTLTGFECVGDLVSNVYYIPQGVGVKTARVSITKIKHHC